MQNFAGSWPGSNWVVGSGGVGEAQSLRAWWGGGRWGGDASAGSDQLKCKADSELWAPFTN